MRWRTYLQYGQRWNGREEGGGVPIYKAGCRGGAARNIKFYKACGEAIINFYKTCGGRPIYNAGSDRVAERKLLQGRRRTYLQGGQQWIGRVETFTRHAVADLFRRRDEYKILQGRRYWIYSRLGEHKLLQGTQW
mmetsp:Transcript_25116/g.49954  ORF Transcript_25116/g.49954 Transcript_25116/m.49954 type:complete len:135 (-) Transcript_25116:159-563(-)